jgi:RNA polymerase sigma-70 factor (ECF subfamily)
MQAGQYTAPRQPAPEQSDACSDAALFDRVAVGDLRAFEQLYRRYHPRLTRFLLSMIRHRELADEVLNDTMFVVWNRSDSYDGRSKLSTWIFGIAYRKALKALRRQDEPVEDKRLDLRPSPDAGPEQELGRHQAQRILLGAIGELSADQRAAVDLSYFHEIGYREIAEIMDCPVGTVKTRIFHARQHLKSRLAGQLGEWL